MLKAYTQDYGWRGFQTVISSSEEKARVVMANDHRYKADAPVEVEEIVEGMTFGHDES